MLFLKVRFLGYFCSKLNSVKTNSTRNECSFTWCNLNLFILCGFDKNQAVLPNYDKRRFGTINLFRPVAGYFCSKLDQINTGLTKNKWFLTLFNINYCMCSNLDIIEEKAG